MGLKAISAEMKKKLRHIRMLALDVDGVLTDACVYYGPQGEALKKFNMRDGMGLELLRRAGVEVAIVTREDTPIVAKRAEKLRITEVRMGILEKLQEVKRIGEMRGLAMEEIAYVGDDLPDLELAGNVGFFATVADGVEAVRQAADYIATHSGGEGAVREVCDLILDAKEND